MRIAWHVAPAEGRGEGDTEIEEEAIHFLDQLTVFRAHARHQDSDAAQEAMVEISLSLQHVADHIQAVTPILDQELGIDDD